MLKVLPRVSARKTAAVLTPIPGMEVRTWHMRVGHPPRSLDLGGDIGPLGAWGDELAGQVGQNHSGGVGAGDSDTLMFQG